MARKSLRFSRYFSGSAAIFVSIDRRDLSIDDNKQMTIIFDGEFEDRDRERKREKERKRREKKRGWREGYEKQERQEGEVHTTGLTAGGKTGERLAEFHVRKNFALFRMWIAIHAPMTTLTII